MLSIQDDCEGHKFKFENKIPWLVQSRARKGSLWSLVLLIKVDREEHQPEPRLFADTIEKTFGIRQWKRELI